MGEARRIGSFEDRKAEAIKAGRTPEVRKQAMMEYKLKQRLIAAEIMAMLLSYRNR